MTKAENEQRLEYLKNIVSNMPGKPGSYQFFDKDKKIIYVGKAKNLKNRVSSYFHAEVDRYKTKVLVSKIFDLTYTVVNTEEDALLLENSLIKKYNPKYNVLLKDGKTYPSICVTNEPYPRIFKTRTINKKWGTYFGPYSHLPSMYAVLELIQKLYHPRTCHYIMTEQGVKEGKYQKCLDYHIHRCEGPCVGKQSMKEYRENISDACEILKGNTRELKKKLEGLMFKYAEELKFEKAEELKQKLILLDSYCSKSEVVSHVVNNIDVFSIEKDEDIAYINYIHVKKGSINTAFTFEYKNAKDESLEELLEMGIVEMRKRFASNAKEVVIPFEIGLEMDGITFTVPQRGDKKSLLDLSKMNVKQYKFDRLKQTEKLNPEQKITRMMKEIQDALKLPTLPMHIECFDNSNISGTSAVAGCVVFKKLKPSRQDYRKFNIKTVEGPDDYASMTEVVRRRYSRMKEEGEKMPDLIITDGGKGQMEVVRAVVEDELHLNIPIAGLAKDNHHRTNELLIGFPPVVVGMDTKSEIFHLFTRIQDEVHRYAITFHRDKRSKQALHSELDDIKGIGPKTKEELIKKLKTVKAIRESSIEVLKEIVGEHKAKLIREHFDNKQ